ncbi:MAG: Hydrolase (HAD superfamily) protein [uncultured bacterium (gcode 4)]|uniref:Hydrolase (HAD superfamily) protein n=1 Tax=uncultured bacterium (gcode 4) TaxID=1234023 RepID=K2G520_9BACT|nr:MAG: Hydrolase (HAD superfamily) protein [uncultured bacterium (gcode 4)]
MNDMQKLFGFIQFLEKSKKTMRYADSDTVINRDNLASHTWQAMLMNYIAAENPEFGVDPIRVIKLTLVHDLPEILTGNDDYKNFFLWLSNRDDKYRIWAEIIRKITSELPEESGRELLGLWDEYWSWLTREAIFVKAAEKMESMSFLIYHWASYIDIPEKAPAHPRKAMSDFPLLKGYHKWFNWKLKELYLESGIEWKDEYDVSWESEAFKIFDKIFDFFQMAQKLKETLRYDSSPLIIEKDTAAEHIYRLVFMVFIVQMTLKLEIDLDKALKIAIFHEIYWAMTWDIDNIRIYTCEMTKEEKLSNEISAMEKIREMLPSSLGEEIYGYWQEYSNGESKEAKFVKSLDRLESISHLLYHTHTNFDEADMIAIYCDKAFRETPELNPLLKILKSWLKKEYVLKWWQWKEEYDLI